MFLKSYFSLRYGILAIDELVQWAVSNNYSAIALCDINTTSGILRFVHTCQQQGVHPVAGIDVRNGIDPCYIILAQNNRGFQEANTFLSNYLHQKISFPPRAPYLRNCHVIYPPEKAPKKLNEQEWIGVQSTHLTLIQAPENIPNYDRIIAVEQMVFRSKRDFNTHRLLRAIDNNCLLSKLPKEQETSEKEVFLTREELEQRYRSHPKLLERSSQLIHSCSLHFEFGENAAPKNLATYTGSKTNDLQLIRQLCADGLSYRYKEITDEIIIRIENEIDIIAEKGYLSYFLITWDFTSYARMRGYFYVGRGSGANSIVAYLLRITDVDPLELDLYFERFINLYRKNPPDFDIDFSWKERDEIIQYIFSKYPSATLLCTYNTFQYQSALRELGKVFGLPANEIDALSTGKQVKQLDSLSKLVLKYSHYLNGIPSHLSIHAGGIIISEQPISWYTATFLPPKGFATTQFSMIEAEDIGLYKFDVLSQRGLAKIHDAIQLIEENQPNNPPEDIHNLQAFKKDPAIAALLRSAKAMGCFYVESPAMRMLLIKLNVDNYLQLVAASSIIRPGVSQSGMMRAYILRHRYPEKRKEAPAALLEIMPDTYGVMVYQEDVIKVAHHFADLSLAEADVLRRGMSGKFRSREEFQHVKDQFFSNCRKKGYSQQLVEDIWRQIESFAGYAFSKGHSASYAVESYQSLYLKAHYPLEYMTACINNFGGYYRTEVYIHEARMLGAEILPPNINTGEFNCCLRGKKLILGFLLIQGIEQKLIHAILRERDQNGRYHTLEDLVKRVPIPLEQLTRIIRVGALEDLCSSRKALLWKAHMLCSKQKQENISLQLFDIGTKQYNLPTLDDSHTDLAFEHMELLGFPLCNPFELVADPLEDHYNASEIPQLKGNKINTYGYLLTIKRSRTQSGETMLFGTFIDEKGELIDTVHFPESAKRYPFYGKGIYQLQGIISEEFGYFTIEIGYMRKIPFIEDSRYLTQKQTSENKTKLA